MLRKIINNLISGMMVELNLMTDLSPRLRVRLGSALTIVFASSVVLAYLAFRPYLDPQNRHLVVWSLVFIVVLMISPFLFLPLIRNFKGRYMAGLVVFGWIVTYVAMDYKKQQGIIMLNQELEPIVWKIFTISICSLFTGIWLLESLLKKIFEEKAVYEAEVIVAHEIQNQLLPDVARKTDQYRVLGRSTQAREVGGDYFDVVDLPDQRLALAIGDVSGHNVAAGLLMAITKAAFRTELHYLESLQRLARSLNQTICGHSDRKMFVSFMCGLLDFENGRLELLNAGHLPMLHYQAATGEVVARQPKGMALGIIKDAFFGVETVPFQSGDRFLFLTDGLDETRDQQGNLFGMDRVRRLFRAYADPETFFREARLERMAFCNCEDPEDDITMVMVTV